jgi:hypothetical protein
MKEVVRIAQKASINQAWTRAHALTAQRERYHQSLLRRLARSATMVCTKIVLVPVPVKNARQECTKKNKLLTQVQIIIVIFALSDSTRSKKNKPRAFHATQVVMDSWMEVKFQDVLTVLKTRLLVPRSRRRVKIVRAEGVQAQVHPLVHSVQLDNTSMEKVASSAT